jgi:photosystem II stability/assembly factor-like uncharacterized protein
MTKALLLFLAVVLFAANGAGSDDPWRAQQSMTTASFRGLPAVDARVAWASGTNGAFAHTTDGGETWQVGVVAGAETLDFRDVHAFDAKTAVLLSAGDDARIYRTSDAGKSWSLAFQRKGPSVFFDAVAFWDSQHGIACGDPVDGKFAAIRTDDGGRTWTDIPPASLPPVLEGEAAFAASGTCLVVEGSSNAWLATGGGRVARVFRTTDRGRTWTAHETPVAAGKASAGIFSLAFRDARNGVAVGGDYQRPDTVEDAIAVTSDGGKTWRKIKGTAPAGYRSCVVFARYDGKPALVAVGTNGSDVSIDGGETWRPLGTTGFNAVSAAGGTIWAAGAEGRIARLEARAIRPPFSSTPRRTS